MLCKSVHTVPHLYFWLLTAPRNDYIDEDLPDEDETDASVRVPASLILPSSPVAKKSHPSSDSGIYGWLGYLQLDVPGWQIEPGAGNCRC
jgi:hypothetical protein